MSRHDFVEPYYMVQLSDDDLQEMQTYISRLKNRDYHHREIIHNNPIHSQGTDVYRTCEIHYPNKKSVLNQIGKKIFLDVNEKYYEYDGSYQNLTFKIPEKPTVTDTLFDSLNINRIKGTAYYKITYKDYIIEYNFIDCSFKKPKSKF